MFIVKVPRLLVVPVPTVKTLKLNELPAATAIVLPTPGTIAKLNAVLEIATVVVTVAFPVNRMLPVPVIDPALVKLLLVVNPLPFSINVEPALRVKAEQRLVVLINVTECPAAITTLLAEVGTTPPTQVVVVFQLPVAAEVIICAF